MMSLLNTLCISCGHILRAIHCKIGVDKKLKLRVKEVTFSGTITGNGVTLRQGFEVMLQRIAPETKVMGDLMNNAAGKQPFYPRHVLEL